MGYLLGLGGHNAVAGHDEAVYSVFVRGYLSAVELYGFHAPALFSDYPDVSLLALVVYQGIRVFNVEYAVLHRLEIQCVLRSYRADSHSGSESLVLAEFLDRVLHDYPYLNAVGALIGNLADCERTRTLVELHPFRELRAGFKLKDVFPGATGEIVVEVELYILCAVDESLAAEQNVFLGLGNADRSDRSVTPVEGACERSEPISGLHSFVEAFCIEVFDIHGLESLNAYAVAIFAIYDGIRVGE